MYSFKIHNRNTKELRLKLNHPIFLDINKKYEIGVEKLRIKSFKLNIQNFNFDLVSKDKNIKYNTTINGEYSIKSFKYELRKKILESISKIDEKSKNLKITDLNFKFDVQKINEHQYLIYFLLPEWIDMIPTTDSVTNFYELFSFGVYQIFQGGHPYISYKNPEIFNNQSIIEWHCNIVETSYTNHETNPHQHNDSNILHTTFVDIHFPDTYFMDKKKTMYRPLKKNITEIHEIILKPCNENKENISFKEVILYIHIKEK